VPETAVQAAPPLGAVLDAAAERLRRAGVAQGRREAVHVWSGLSGLRPGAIWLARERPADPSLQMRFDAAVTRRAAGEPLAYVTGRAAFRGLEVAVDARVLIPRPETEGLVDLALRWTAGRPGGLAADVGTGSGCIALALAMEGRFDRIVATDRSPEAAAVALANVSQVAPSVPVEVRVGDLLEPLADMRLRVIVANPPYLTLTEWEALGAEVRVHEPQAALASGADGLDATRGLLAQAAGLLEPGGLLAVEIDERRAGHVAQLARGSGFATRIHEDVFGRPRYALAVREGDPL
jgi:release factor glutamine methyltransferase